MNNAGSEIGRQGTDLGRPLKDQARGLREAREISKLKFKSWKRLLRRVKDLLSWGHFAARSSPPLELSFLASRALRAESCKAPG